MNTLNEQAVSSTPINLIAVGITHKTATLDLRERFAFNDAEIKALLVDLCDGLTTEALMLSTCNRTELYAVPASPEVTASYLIDFIIERKGLRRDASSKQFFQKYACGVAKHFFTVASAADSMILGEAQILGQVKNAYRLSSEVGAAKTILNRLCHDAFSVAKRVKSETEFAEGAISISYAAVELSKKIFSDISEKNVLLIGAGETAELAAKHMIEKKARRISITNRTLQNAQKLANDLGTSTIIPFDAFKDHLYEYDVVISAVGTIGEILTADEIESAMQKRSRNAMLFLDLGVPHNIDRHANSLYNVFLKDIDDLQFIVQKNLLARQEELPKVEKIILDGLIQFENWHNSLQVSPTIKALQEKFLEIKEQELSRLKNKVSESEFKLLEQLADRLIGKLLHFPIRSLKSPIDSSDSISNKVYLLRSLFDLTEAGTSEERKK